MSNDIPKEPQVSQGLVEYLEYKWPLDIFMSAKSTEDLFLQQGRRQVISYLKVLLERQTDNRIF